MENLITTFPEIEIKEHEPLAHYTNTKTGGPADWLAFPVDVAQVQQLVDYCHQTGLALTVIGNASNLIVRDGGIEGLVMILTRMQTVKVEGTMVTAAAGAYYIEVTKIARDHSLTGLEFAAGIPGSIGGAIFMNAGAYGGETKTVVDHVTVMERDGQIHQLSNEEMDFGYRHSAVQASGAIVLDATFALKLGDQNAITAQMEDLNARRAAKQPLELPSCGSVFKRPTSYFAGKLIHDAGLQGYTSGGAQVSTKHAGFIVNVNHGTATDYLNVIHHVQETVQEKFGVQLETEVRIIGRQS